MTTASPETLTPAPKPEPISDERKLAALELLELAINTPSEIADVSITYSAYTTGISAMIYAGGWKKSKGTWNFDQIAYLDWEDDQITPLLANVRAHLASLIAK